MIQEEKVIVFDIDGTLCETVNKGLHYFEAKPKKEMIEKVREYKEQGYYIILFTSRQMRTHNGNIGKINAETAKILFLWLDKHKIPYDEIHFGKPWCGKNGFYVDDKTVRPREFRELSHDKILKLLEDDK